MPVSVMVQRVGEVERDIEDIKLEWPLKMGRLFNLKITCGDEARLDRFRVQWEAVPDERLLQFVGRYAPLCYEGLGRLKSVRIRNNVHEIGLFVYEVLVEITLLVAILNREFSNYDYLGRVFEAFKFARLPRNYESLARKLMEWTSLSLDDTIQLAEEFMHNFREFATEQGVEFEDHTPLEKLQL
jgi:hypothetical protein